jgi:RAB protein geranylgeranyltransferase component A
MFDYAMERDRGDRTPDSPSTTHPAFWGYRKDKDMTLSRAASMSRHFSIDTNPKMLLSFGPMVDAIIASGVSSYIEFVSIEGLYYLQADAKGTAKICSVPSSKADVFKSKLLGALEKRSLMKLLQTAVSYGNTLRGVDVTDQREAVLAKGRALHQPQNASSEVVAAINLDNEKLEEQSMLAFMEKHKIPEHLRSVVLYSMCMSRTSDCTAAAGLEFLYRHIYACGRLGETAFLYPHYGTSEIPESFCRSAAVHGAVYALRQTVTSFAVKSPLPASTTPGSVADASSSAPDASKEGNEESASSQVGPRPRSVALLLGSKQVITCDFLISNFKNFRPTTLGDVSPSKNNEFSTKQFNVQRVSICTGETLLPVGKGVAVLPPMLSGLGNKYPVILIQFNSTAMVCPVGSFMLYAVTAIDAQDPSSNDAAAVSESNKIASYLKTIHDSNSSGGGSHYTELYFATSIEPLSIESGMDGLYSDVRKINENIHIRDVGLERASVVSDDFMKEVAALFRLVCPGEEFFGDSALATDAPIGAESAEESGAEAGAEASVENIVPGTEQTPAPLSADDA